MGAQVVVFKRIDRKYTKIQQENLTAQTAADFKGCAGLLRSLDQRFLYVGNWCLFNSPRNRTANFSWALFEWR
ncbi:hypothetical protein B9T34_12550 [Acinetobacter sp. ANC 3813]|nr:hypothetical protein B9T34_12550 [Acinetobacter sp. ANC 3813]